MLLAIEKITTAGGTQSRAAIDWSTVEEYSDAYRRGVNMPAVVVFFDGEKYWLADGFHRINAAQSAELGQIDADVHQGTREDAVWFSLGANKAHGLRRTNADKRRAVTTALQHPKSAGLSDRAIAEHCGVDHKTVAAIREELEPRGEVPQQPRRTGRDGKQYKPKTKAPKQRQTEEIETDPVAAPDPGPGIPLAAAVDYDAVAAIAMDLVRLAEVLPLDQQDTIVRLVCNRIGSRKVA